MESTPESKPLENIRKLVVTGALGALAVFLGITRLGFFPWVTGAPITILHIPAIIGAILEGPLVGAGIGAIFGVFSLVQANIAPLTPVDIAFRNPLVSVVPRILFPIAAWAIYRAFGKRHKIPAVFVGAVLGTVVHTILVLGALILTKGSGILTGGVEGVTLWAVVGALFAANGIPEAIAAGLFASLVVAARLGLASKKGKSRLSGE